MKVKVCKGELLHQRDNSFQSDYCPLEYLHECVSVFALVSRPLSIVNHNRKALFTEQRSIVTDRPPICTLSVSHSNVPHGILYEDTMEIESD